jgi:hypothetical protein
VVAADEGPVMPITAYQGDTGGWQKELAELTAYLASAA